VVVLGLVVLLVVVVVVLSLLPMVAFSFLQLFFSAHLFFGRFSSNFFLPF
jgi:hypothetical protein